MLEDCVTLSSSAGEVLIVRLLLPPLVREPAVCHEQVLRVPQLLSIRLHG